MQPNVPVILMTGFGWDPAHSIVKARQEGLQTVLYKPFRADRLMDAVEQALRLVPAARPPAAHPRDGAAASASAAPTAEPCPEKPQTDGHADGSPNAKPADSPTIGPMNHES